MLNIRQPIIERTGYQPRRFIVKGTLENGHIVGVLEQLPDSSSTPVLLILNPRTHSVVQRWAGDPVGGALSFINEPEVKLYGDTLASSGVGVNVTETDGVVTKVELVG